MSILNKVKGIVSEKFDVKAEDLNENTNFMEDLNADSIELFDLVMTLEDEYDFEVADEDLEKLVTIGDAVNYIEKMEIM